MWVQIHKNTACYRPFKNGHFIRVRTERMMNDQYGENGARNVYSNYNQMRAYVVCSLNQSKKWYFIDLSIKQSAKLWRFWKSAGRFCIWILPEYCSLALPAHVYKMVITTVCVQINNCVHKSLSINVHHWGDFVARFCQPSRNVSGKKMTYFQWLLTPIMNPKLSVNMIWIRCQDNLSLWSRKIISWFSFVLWLPI